MKRAHSFEAWEVSSSDEGMEATPALSRDGAVFLHEDAAEAAITPSQQARQAPAPQPQLRLEEDAGPCSWAGRLNEVLNLDEIRSTLLRP